MMQSYCRAKTRRGDRVEECGRVLSTEGFCDRVGGSRPGRGGGRCGFGPTGLGKRFPHLGGPDLHPGRGHRRHGFDGLAEVLAARVERDPAPVGCVDEVGGWVRAVDLAHVDLLRKLTLEWRRGRSPGPASPYRYSFLTICAASFMPSRLRSTRMSSAVSLRVAVIRSSMRLSIVSASAPRGVWLSLAIASLSCWAALVMSVFVIALSSSGVPLVYLQYRRIV